MSPFEVGSDFETSAWDLWPGDGLDLGAAVPVMSGRQALALVAAEMKQDGIRVCLFPDHYCTSMATPFLSAGIELIVVPCDSDLLMIPEALRLASQGLKAPFGVLHCDTLGSVASEDLTSVLWDLDARGNAVVVDATHSFLGEPTPSPKYVVVSLRKLLGLPDGAYVRGLRRSPTLAPTAEDIVARRVEGARFKQNYLDGGLSAPTHLKAFSRAEAKFDELTEPCAMSTLSLTILAGLNLDGIAERRRENYRTVTLGLADIGYRVLGTGFGADRSAAFAVIRSAHAKTLRKRAAQSGVYCPIHWPAPPGYPQEWRSDLLSVPVDQRYAESDMRWLIEVFSVLCKEGST